MYVSTSIAIKIYIYLLYVERCNLSLMEERDAILPTGDELSREMNNS